MTFIHMDAVLKLNGQKQGTYIAWAVFFNYKMSARIMC